MDRARIKFDALRAKHLAARDRFDAVRSDLAARYGAEYLDSWLKPGERSALARCRAALEKSGDALFAHVQSFSPRDWSYGVPVSWVREELTFEDAARPLGEPLSVVPPLSFGSSHPRT